MVMVMAIPTFKPSMDDIQMIDRKTELVNHELFPFIRLDIEINSPSTRKHGCPICKGISAKKCQCRGQCKVSRFYKVDDTYMYLAAGKLTQSPLA